MQIFDNNDNYIGRVILDEKEMEHSEAFLDYAKAHLEYVKSMKEIENNNEKIRTESFNYRIDVTQSLLTTAIDYFFQYKIKGHEKEGKIAAEKAKEISKNIHDFVQETKIS